MVPPGFGDVRTIGDLCDRVAQDLDGAFPNDPVTEADIRNTIGHIYMALDKRKQSEFQLQKAFNMRKAVLGPAHELRSLVIEGMGRAGHYSTAERESGKYCRIVEEMWGDCSPETMSALLDHSQSQMQAGLIEEAVDTAQRAYGICGNLPDASPDTRRTALNIYTSNLVAAGRIAEAKELFGHR